MINHAIPSDTFQLLKDAPFEFILTGSQFFAGKGNDWDYFVQYSEEVIQFLSLNGFRTISSLNYNDTNCCGVYRKGKFDIQIVYDAALKVKVQEKFLQAGILSPTTKQWNLAFTLLS